MGLILIAGGSVGQFYEGVQVDTSKKYLFLKELSEGGFNNDPLKNAI